MTDTTQIELPTAPGPHAASAADDAREQFTARLFDTLWDRYRRRVSHVATYERVIADAGAAFVNDHIAFRTFAGQEPLCGIASISRVFEALGYRAADSYDFDDKHLTALHYQHPNGNFPKLFISELRTWELSRPARERIERAVRRHRPPLAAETLASIVSLAKDPESVNQDSLLRTVIREFHDLPWPAPEKADVVELNKESQYAAWVLVHGYNVNHFTSLINSHGVDSLGDIERTIDALKQAGVPMKVEIEGARGTKLRQTATEAAVIDVPVQDNGRPAMMPWTYAYFELAERGDVTDLETGRTGRFEGFLGPQATHLFEMTRKK